ncbi:MAG: HAD hydrolase-like protein [Anaerolineae bacterium]|nr:HAD hydrolase-like protein [Anaerolineae bacterium]
MTITLLLDLDDTLLNNNIDTFLSGYLKALARHLANHVPPEKIAPHLMAATGKMIANRNPILTLEEAFDADFYPALGTAKPVLLEPLTRFYEDVFPSLASLTSPRPEAVRLVEKAFTHGWRVVIATNPLFPRRAIEHRLAWAGLPVTEYAFDLITTYEDMHYSKPSPNYYAEILAQLGWPEDPAVMVGNSLEDDILPAAKVGMPVFWLDDSQNTLPADLPAGSRKGKLDDVLAWAESIDRTGARIDLQNAPAMLATMSTTPSALQNLMRSAPAQALNVMPGPGEWCFTEVICHLRDSDREINLPRIARILSQDNAFIAGVNADVWSETRSYCSEDTETALQGFCESRIQLVERLASLTPDEWQHAARHAIFGPTNLFELVGFIASHDRTHIQQAQQTLKAAVASL